MEYLQLKVFAMHGEEVYSDVFDTDEEEMAYSRLAEQLKKVPCCNGYLIRVYRDESFAVLVKFDTFTGISR